MNKQLCRSLAIVVSVASVAFAAWHPGAFADEAASGNETSHHSTSADSRNAGGLVSEVLAATERFRDVSAAEAEGYGAFLGCVSGPQEGAMGVHFANGPLVNDGLLDAARPEVLVYEPRKDGRMRLVAVEYIVVAEAWHAVNTDPPVLSGQTLHYVGSPNRYGLPAFYELHVWAWKSNPHGMYVDWNPKVTCENYSVDPT